MCVLYRIAVVTRLVKRVLMMSVLMKMSDTGVVLSGNQRLTPRVDLGLK